MTETTITLRHPDGRSIAFKMDLDPDFVSDKYIIKMCNKQACYEPEVAWVMMRALRPGDKVVDVGACVGFFTLLAAKLVGPEGKVVAVEPGADNLPRLKRNLKINGLTAPEEGDYVPAAVPIPFPKPPVDVIEQPLFARVEEVKFWYNRDSSGGHALWDPGKWHENEKTRASGLAFSKVEAATLNRIAPSPCRLIKIDTEGAEERILQGANNVLMVQHPPFIIAEMNEFGLKQMMCSPDSLRAYMRVFGYDTFVIFPDGATPELVPPRKGIVVEHVYNVLFSTPSDVASIWQ